MSVFLESLNKSGHLERLHMTLCNVGSRKLESEDDYASKGWSIFAPRLTIYGFDADPDACDLANADLKTRSINWTEQHIAVALGGCVGESTLYVTQDPMCSSLYQPNEPYLERFKGLSDLVNLDFTLEIETTSLDAITQNLGIQKIDFLQLDIQGAELDVLEGAARVLETSILAVQVEVEFSALYLNQPLFADVDSYMRKAGFTLFDLVNSYRPRTRSPIVSNQHPGQLLWADAYYFRDLIQEENSGNNLSNPEKILKLACIADVMDFPDYALELLEYLTLEYGKKDINYNYADNIVESLAKFPKLKKQLGSLSVIENIRDYIKDYQF